MNLLKKLLMVVIAALTASCQPIVATPSASVLLPTVTSEEASYEELLRHAHMGLIDPNDPSSAPRDPLIIFGDVPPNWPVLFRFPPGTRIIGSISYPDEVGGSIYATTQQLRSEAGEFLQTAFHEVGYEPNSDMGTFMAEIYGPGTAYYLLCGPDPYIEIEIVLYESAEGQTNIQIHSTHTSNAGGPCLARSLSEGKPLESKP